MTPLPSISTPNKRHRVDAQSDRPQAATPSKDNIPWRCESRSRIYYSKLVEALFRARNTSIASSQEDSAAKSGGDGVLGEVREIADRVLATAAKGSTRWSKAILSNRIRVHALGKRGQRKVRQVASASGGNRLRKGRRLALPAIERRVKVLGRLIPGCRGISVTSLLEEATDYIAALEMQVKVMTDLSQLLGAPAIKSSAPANDDVDDVSVPSARG